MHTDRHTPASDSPADRVLEHVRAIPTGLVSTYGDINPAALRLVGRVQQMRDLLECVWPAALDTAKQPFRSAPGSRRYR